MNDILSGSYDSSDVQEKLVPVKINVNLHIDKSGTSYTTIQANYIFECSNESLTHLYKYKAQYIS